MGASQVRRVERQVSWRGVLRAVLFLVGLGVGVGISWVISPHDDVGLLDVNLARGVFLGVLLGAILAFSWQSDRRRPPGSKLPPGFGTSLDDLRRELGDEPGQDAGEGAEQEAGPPRQTGASSSR